MNPVGIPWSWRVADDLCATVVSSADCVDHVVLSFSSSLVADDRRGPSYQREAPSTVHVQNRQGDACLFFPAPGGYLCVCAFSEGGNS